MGVHGLWELLAPVGRRVSVETLTGKKLAIDASIWMIQFMKAMRDDKGEMVRNAHILGFFRRICKLLYLRTKPVFVFDGGTPALKRRTVIARRRQRENAQAKVRKTAEKLLLNHLKAMRLKELAADLENQRQKNDIKGKKAVIEEPIIEQNTHKGNEEVNMTFSREELDEMLAASLAAEENEGFAVDASGSGATRSSGDKVDEDEEDDDEDEEMILPEMHGKVDPAVLAALPPSMQLDLLVQMRERLMAENRQKYQKVKKVPERFSELQIQAYLKTVAFRREIDGVQKSAAGRGIGGVQTSRIASEANREFIFSSTFTGDKQVLTSVGQKSIGIEHNQNRQGAVDEVRPIVGSDTWKGLTEDPTETASHQDVNTYLDERGRLRVSRVRALGIRMTRDLQRNLDLMKEIEQEKADAKQKKLNETTITTTLDDLLGGAPDRIQHCEVDNQNNDGMNNETEDASEKIGTMKISFEATGYDYGNDDDDNLFATLVAGHSAVDLCTDHHSPLKQSLPSDPDIEWEEGVIEDKSNIVCNKHKAESDHSSPLKQSLSSDSDIEWEEGVIEDKSNIVCNNYKAETNRLFMEKGMSDEAKVELEEESQGIQPNSSSCLYEVLQPVRKGALVEEAEIQEAIRRSLEDMIDNETLNKPCEDQESGRSEKMVNGDNQGISVTEAGLKVEIPTRDVIQPIECNPLYPAEMVSNETHLNQDISETEALSGETVVAVDSLLPAKDLCRTEEQIHVCNIGGNEHAIKNPVDTCNGELLRNGGSFTASTSSADFNPDRLHNNDLVDAQRGMFHVAVDDPFSRSPKFVKISARDSVTDADCTNELANEKIYVDFSVENDMPMRNPSAVDVDEAHEVKEVDLQEEMMFLQKEREELGIEQRKLERNAESVSSEMFAECQELLQMFGLPYIIAPMEAEAQCAYMEFLDLVDGVVTDDSDAFLFGASSVYKNIFDDRKYVETYLLKDIENELGLNREKLMNMALLLGSDYTEGVSGIGIVNAMEVVNAFPEKNGLHEFWEWIESPDPTILGDFDGQAGGKSKGKGSNGHDEKNPCDQDNIKMTKQIFMDKHRNVSKNWHVPSSFPSDAVISAYTSPQVDKSTEPFSWGKPDLYALRKLCWEKFGWGSSKADELLLPVLKEYNKHETQLRLEAFYSFNERFAKIRSKRIKKAVKGITGNRSSEMMDQEMPKQSRVGKKRKANPMDLEAETSGSGLKEAEHGGTADQVDTTRLTSVGMSKRGGRKKNVSRLDESDLEQSSNIDQNLGIRNKTRGVGQNKGRARRKVAGRGKGKRKSHFKDAETSDDDDDDDDVRGGEEKEGLQLDKSEESQVRRSGRLQQVLNYCIPDELDDGDKESEVVKDTSCAEQGVDEVTYVDGVEVPGIGGELLVGETEQKNMTDKWGKPQDDDYPIGTMDYLQFGGGFCSDEEDKDTEVGGFATSPTGGTNSEKSNIIADLDSTEEVKPKTGSSYSNSDVTENLRRNDASDAQIMKDNVDDDSNVSSTVLLNSMHETEDDPENHSMRFLRAMPNLRRKRKKNI